MRWFLASWLLLLCTLHALSPWSRTTYACSGMGSGHRLAPCCRGEAASRLSSLPRLRRARCCAAEASAALHPPLRPPSPPELRSPPASLPLAALPPLPLRRLLVPTLGRWARGSPAESGHGPPAPWRVVRRI